MTEDPHRTLHAQQAFELSDVFAFKFGAVRFGTRRPRRLEMSRPDGPSTSGGRQARQNLVLAPTEADGTSPIVVGWVDSGARRAELRSFRTLGKQFQARHGRGIDLEADAYGQLEEELSGFFGMQGIDLAVVDPTTAPPPDAVVEQGPRESSGPMFAMLGLGVVLGLGLGFVLFSS